MKLHKKFALITILIGVCAAYYDILFLSIFCCLNMIVLLGYDRFEQVALNAREAK